VRVDEDAAGPISGAECEEVPAAAEGAVVGLGLRQYCYRECMLRRCLIACKIDIPQQFQKLSRSILKTHQVFAFSSAGWFCCVPFLTCSVASYVSASQLSYT